MTSILGISAFYHDSAAAIVVDGKLIAAAQEERFSRKKHDESFPIQAARFCLKQAQLRIEDLDFIGFYEKPIVKLERLLETYLAFSPAGYSSFRRAMPIWLNKKLHTRSEIRRAFDGKFSGRIIFADHHESHAASAFFPSPFASANIITIDGVGEWSTTCLGQGTENRITLTTELRFPHSLGLLYSAFTYYTGFKVNSGEYKLMGLAPFGTPVYHETILKNLIDLKSDGSFHLDMDYFDFAHGLTMTNAKFDLLFGGPPRRPESPLTQKEMDLAASIQTTIEEILLLIANHSYRQNPNKNLVLAGGVALNCVANGRLWKEGPFENIWVQPAAGDAGCALGVALFIWFHLMDQPRLEPAVDSQLGSLLGPEFNDDAIERVLCDQQLHFHRAECAEDLVDWVSQALEQQKVVGWFQGRMEFGPRALGNRSILADARSIDMQFTLNEKIKHRESFRPFAPIVLREHASKLFELTDNQPSPYMSFTVKVLPQHRKGTSDQAECTTGVERLRFPRSTIESATHADYSARVQTVDEQQNPLLHKLLVAFHARTDCPVLINTSFNVRGEPIVCTPEEAINCFMSTDMDILVLGMLVVHKDEQTNTMPIFSVTENRLELD